MQEDASRINLTQVELDKLESKLERSFNIYQTNLDDILALGSHCLDNPEAFLASLHEINERRQLILEDTTTFLDFVNQDLQAAMAEVQERLLMLEH